MSKPSSTSDKAPSQAPANASAWSRGPPASNPSSNVASSSPSPSNDAPGSNPVAIGKKGSLMVGGNSDVPRGQPQRLQNADNAGNLAFGTVDSPNPLLSSSPAAPSTTGGHLADAVKSFGSIDAETTATGSSMIRPPRRTSGSTPADAPAARKKLDVHSLFAGKPQQAGSGSSMSPPPQQGSPAAHDRRQSLGQSSFPSNGMPYQQMPGQPHLRPPQGMQGQPRSPVMGGQPQFNPQQSFRVPQNQQQAVRPGNGPMGVPRPMMGQQMPYGMPYNQSPGGYQMMHPQGNYYVSGLTAPVTDPSQYGVSYEQNQYGMPQQWMPQQHSPNMPLSPRSAQAQLGQPSPAPPNAQLPGSAGGSPMPTPPSRPQSLVGGQSTSSPMPTTPSRPLQPGTPFTPQAPAPQTPGLSPGAAAFTPRPKQVIKIARPDGTPVNLSEEAAAAKGPTASSTPETPEEPPRKKMPTLPVLVRMESEEQKKARLAEEEKLKKIKEQEEKEEAERKERRERREKEEAERKAKQEEEEQMAKAAEAAKQEAEEVVEAEKSAEEPKPALTDKEKQDELRRSLMTPAASVVSSPLASPALAAAGLPAKPLSALNPASGSRRPTPSSLDIKSTPSALSSAKPIENLGSIEYPASVKPQSAELNAKSEPGKFRYDRDFLMQFMEVCKDKPDSLPNLEEIGLEADTSSGFGQSRRGNRGPMGSSSRTAPGLGMPMGSGRPFTGNPMGSFGYSGRQGSSGGMPRPRSGPSGGMHMSRPPRGSSGRGHPRKPQNEPDVAPLQVSANAWVNARSAGTDEKSPVYIERKVKALLNKLTEEKFDSISKQILEWANKSREETDGMTLKLVIKLVFEKSTDEAHWSAMYAKLCRLLLDQLDPAVTEVIDGKSVSGGSLFRKYLLGRCQADFEAGWKAREEAALAAMSTNEADKQAAAQSNEGDAPLMSDEYYALQKAKRRGLGLVQLIGELYKLEMLSRGVIRECLVRLLGNVEKPDEEDLESTCKLLTTVGKQFEASSTQPLDPVFDRLKAIVKNDSISSRIRFMVMDVIDLRKNKWQSRKEVVPTTIAQIHQQAARENAEKAQAARESISRGGSRAGHSRREGPQPGEWQSVGATGPRPPQRPTDYSNLGRGVSSAGMAAAPTFGPSGVFARGKKGSASGSTPPLSRHSSTTNMSNMFNILNETGDSAGDAAEAPQRKKLQLAPRTKPLPSKEGSDEESEGEGEVEMTEEAAKNKIKMDAQELWGEKDSGGSRNPEDIVEYYRALPSEYRHLLSEKLCDDVFRIAKLRDAEVVAKGWSAALKENAASLDDLKKGLEGRMPTLDDDAIDFPQAYKAIATIMRSLDLNAEDIDALVAMIDVYGEPKITPKMKLEKALGQVDEEAASA
ncbi:eukaryotic initiation factor 4F subunit [Trichosporon asahii var. asahii CBS 8904]|uniref:Eukaryotic initiation factor 4F subunit n=1 Tax=Trichosporon asahii var. asahii (strain CBS 8904) TaxID=1220162 RepID=K1VU03_TRIAC|nr:eukaryotic initiation factor 4F subunit [Trichosporon asahii var. asahii CBS 8904]